MNNWLSKDATPAQKLDYIMMHIFKQGKNVYGVSQSMAGAMLDLSASVMHITPEFFGCDKYTELAFYLNTMVQKGYLSGGASMGNRDFGGLNIQYPDKRQFTYEGLLRIAEIENTGIISNYCFVAMRFDNNKVNRFNSIQKACSKFNFEALLVDEHRTPNNDTIDSKIIAAIKSSRFCIADFTGLNHGAYFEAGFAMGRNMKVVLICESKDFEENKKHFDISHYPFIKYESWDDLTEKLITEIGAYITN